VRVKHFTVQPESHRDAMVGECSIEEIAFGHCACQKSKVNTDVGKSGVDVIVLSHKSVCWLREKPEIVPATGVTVACTAYLLHKGCAVDGVTESRIIASIIKHFCDVACWKRKNTAVFHVIVHFNVFGVRIGCIDTYIVEMQVVVCVGVSKRGKCEIDLEEERDEVGNERVAVGKGTKKCAIERHKFAEMLDAENEMVCVGACIFWKCGCIK